MSTSLSIIGGFLGAGKTTLINNLATKYTEMDLKVGIVTNDQGSNLVDTQYLKSQGFTVVEIDGGCFCCNFDQFKDKVNDLALDITPDIILAEPVGSCTDLIATIYKPLLDKNININFGNDLAKTFRYAPLCVIADPKRIRRFIKGSNDFSNEINYLFHKQLEEANIILLNKIDLLSTEELEEMKTFLMQNYPGIDVIPISARNNENVSELCLHLLDKNITLGNSLEIDYPTYGEAERQLGWLNLKVDINFENQVDVNGVVSELINNYKSVLIKNQNEIAHLKVYGLTKNDFCKASLVSIYEDLDFNTESNVYGKDITLIINARIHTSATNLKEIIETSTSNMITTLNGSMTTYDFECFEPGYPTPIHRM